MDAGMDNGLPSLAVVEDVAELVSDDEDDTLKQATPDSVASVLEDVRIADEEDTPFVKQEIAKAPKPKKKKELSEKQKAHMKRLADARREKTRLMKEAKAIVDMKTQEELEKIQLREKKKSYKKATQKLDHTEPREKEDDENDTPDDFVPSHKEKMKQKVETEQERESRMFMSFMSNMEKYQKLRADYETEKSKSKPKPKKVMETKKVIEPVPLQILNEPKSSPFDSYFG